MTIFQVHIPGRTIPYSVPIGPNIGFYQILQEFNGSDEILLRQSINPARGSDGDGIALDSYGFGCHVEFRWTRNMSCTLMPYLT
ncbi:unnamed protein product [Adineta ricciae]|uniref:Uncharacterized protein n=1 Tax=Adineta ricciae TaxID=249248 RepID=A0A815ZB33_ADIRI|nr:unnamed protein product [Adineta ricciae]